MNEMIIELCKRNSLKKLFQATKILAVVRKMECESIQTFDVRSEELFQKFHHQLSNQPIEFTASGFYTINTSFLASVNDFVKKLLITLIFILLR